MLNTIRLEKTGRGIQSDWKKVAEKLEQGVRHRDLPSGAIGSDTTLAPIAYTQQITRLQVENELALERIQQLEAELRELHERFRQSLLTETGDLKVQIGRLQQQLEDLRQADR